MRDKSLPNIVEAKMNRCSVWKDTDSVRQAFLNYEFLSELEVEQHVENLKTSNVTVFNLQDVARFNNAIIKENYEGELVFNGKHHVLKIYNKYGDKKTSVTYYLKDTVTIVNRAFNMLVLMSRRASSDSSCNPLSHAEEAYRQGAPLPTMDQQ